MSLRDDTLDLGLWASELAQSTSPGSLLSREQLSRKILTNLFGDGPAPTRLGHYILLSKLGEGGMGLVYAAFDEKLDRKVALKLLRERGDSRAQQRLVREAQALARLSHPNVVQIYEIGELESQTFIVMEFVSGVTLGEWLRERERSRSEILDVFVAAGQGLAAAHARGLVHRDFKPTNVMIGDDGRVRVMDFGLARELDVAALSHRGSLQGLSTDLTVAGAIMGTPAYMAPEQFHARETGPQTDQFSFCSTLWEALYGSRPFRGATYAELSDAVIRGHIESVEGADVPGWLHQVLVRGLAVEPGQRWPSFEVLLDALRRDPTHRRRWFAGLLGALAVVLSVFAGLRLSDHLEQEAAIRACELEGLALEATWNDGTRSRLGQSFSEAGHGAWPALESRLDHFARDWASQRGDACLASRVEQTLDDRGYRETKSCLDESKQVFEAITGALADPNRSRMGRITLTLANLAPPSSCRDEVWLEHRMELPLDPVARERVEDLRIELLSAYFSGDPRLPAIAEQVATRARELESKPLEAEARARAAVALIDTADHATIRAMLEQAYYEARRSGYDLLALELSSWLAYVVGHRLGELDEGIHWAKLGEVLADRLQLGGSTNYAFLLLARGIMESKQGDLVAALESNREALQIYEATFGPEHVQVPISLTNLGHTLRSLRRFQEALSSYDRAIELYEALLPLDDPKLAYALTGLGKVQIELRDYDEARVVLERALRIRSQAQSPLADLADAQFSLARALWPGGDQPRAWALALKARDNYLRAGPGGALDLEFVDAWIRRHRVS